MGEYIEREAVMNMLNRFFCSLDGNEAQVLVSDIKHATMELPAADVVEVVRCKDCGVPHNKWTGCPNLNGLIPPSDFYCAKGTPKKRGADKPKITCLNCKHLMFSDMYGECNKQLKIVNPSDTCEHAEPK